MSYEICHCGNGFLPHNFRHVYQKTTNVTRHIENDCEYFTINISDFPVKIKTKCSKDQCMAVQSVHDTVTLPHKYIPVNLTYHEANFTVPEDALCQAKSTILTEYEKKTEICGKKLNDHGKVMTHCFTLNLITENKGQNDIINLIHPEDEDIKIVWK